LEFGEELEAEPDVVRREERVRSELENGGTEGCHGQFELLETHREFTFDNDEKVFDFDLSQRALLFLKINALLDREQRSVFNLVLVANDRSHGLAYSLSARNYLLVRLLVTDLNDNSPQFGLPKYEFRLDEVVAAAVASHARLLEATCSALQAQLRVAATDADAGLNGQVRYKLLQQVHRKNANFRENAARVLGSEQGPAPGSLFVVDASTGQISLEVCQRLAGLANVGEAEFGQLTALLDHELYSRHILVVEASDSAVYSPLQAFVTVEIVVEDLNDHAPFVAEFSARGCAANIRVEHFKARQFVSMKQGPSLRPDGTFVSAKIVISGKCIFSFESKNSFKMKSLFARVVNDFSFIDYRLFLKYDIYFVKVSICKWLNRILFICAYFFVLFLKHYLFLKINIIY